MKKEQEVQVQDQDQEQRKERKSLDSNSGLVVVVKFQSGVRNVIYGHWNNTE